MRSGVRNTHGILFQCSNTHKYKGIRIPKCDKGRGCLRCWLIFHGKNPEYALRERDR